MYLSIATSITRHHLATCDTTKKFHREQICHRMWTPDRHLWHPTSQQLQGKQGSCYYHFFLTLRFNSLFRFTEGKYVTDVFFLSRSLQWLFLSASFHSQCPQGSLAKGNRRGRAEEVMQELVPENYVKEPNMTLYQLMYFCPIFVQFFSFVIVAFFVGIFPLGMQAWFAGHAHSCFVFRFTIHEEKWGTTRSLPFSRMSEPSFPVQWFLS